VKALSFRQPWANLTVLGLKPVDNRPWRTDYRGPIYIHAADGPDWFPPPYTEEWLLSNLDQEGRELYLAMPRTRGALIGEGVLVDCIKMGAVPLFPEYRSPVQWSPWFLGPFGLVLADPKRYEKPITWPGALKLFEVNIERGNNERQVVKI
jgi:hypothetical protein